MNRKREKLWWLAGGAHMREGESRKAVGSGWALGVLSGHDIILAHVHVVTYTCPSPMTISCLLSYPLLMTRP